MKQKDLLTQLQIKGIDLNASGLFGRVEEVSEGTAVYRTGKTAGIGVSDGMIGRVVDALGAPIDLHGLRSGGVILHYFPLARSSASAGERATGIPVFGLVALMDERWTTSASAHPSTRGWSKQTNPIFGFTCAICLRLFDSGVRSFHLA